MPAIRLLVLDAVRRHGRAHGHQVGDDLGYRGAHERSTYDHKTDIRSAATGFLAGVLTEGQENPYATGERHPQDGR
ncbi:hypothetical protein ABZ299_02530 [Streptomyces sp. NPDC006184]|uniref:hypothetical protein n=1 Tax=Streptomyces sp. NPDC006184 TaxID=3155455 RepID=UPI0033BD2562